MMATFACLKAASPFCAHYTKLASVEISTESNNNHLGPHSCKGLIPIRRRTFTKSSG
ncbi:hypothetical protein Mapa_012196 [Marchantia paleacea]|nr:hypothetical protein Mapa_012196 [Marchantia paleacea]